MNCTLEEGIPEEVLQQTVEVAFDFHVEPFYGKPPELRTYTCRSKTKKGTTHFFRIASAYVIWRQVPKGEGTFFSFDWDDEKN